MIKCEGIEMVEPHRLVPNPKNPNTHKSEQIDRIIKIIDFQGWRSPIVVSKQSGFIVVGHGRVEAALKAGWERVPVSYQDFADEAQEYAHLTADNAIASWSNLDLSKINTDIIDLGPDLDVDLLGIKDFEVEPLDKLDVDLSDTSSPVDERCTQCGQVVKNAPA